MLLALWAQQSPCKGLAHRELALRAEVTMDTDSMALESGERLPCRQGGLVETRTMELLVSVLPLSSLVAQRKPRNLPGLT